MGASHLGVPKRRRSRFLDQGKRYICTGILYCRLHSICTCTYGFRYSIFKVLVMPCYAVTSLRFTYVASHCTLGNFYWRCFAFFVNIFGASYPSLLSLATSSHCTLGNFFANCRNFFHIFSWQASYWWFFQSHCLSLYIAEFFRELPELFKYIFCAGHLVPRGVPVLMTARGSCAATHHVVAAGCARVLAMLPGCLPYLWR